MNCLCYTDEAYLTRVADATSVVCWRWFSLCCVLGLSASLLLTVERENSSDMAKLHVGLTHWLQRNYNTEKYGPPTWRKLVMAVDSTSGRNNYSLALKIAKQHQVIGTCVGVLHSLVLYSR